MLSVEIEVGGKVTFENAEGETGYLTLERGCEGEVCVGMRRARLEYNTLLALQQMREAGQNFAFLDVARMLNHLYRSRIIHDLPETE